MGLDLTYAEWQQDLDRGIFQGSSSSAEMFARTVEHFHLGATPRSLGQCVALWSVGFRVQLSEVLCFQTEPE